jgi:adenylylsulfate kinase-like enzyme
MKENNNEIDICITGLTSTGKSTIVSLIVSVLIEQGINVKISSDEPQESYNAEMMFTQEHIMKKIKTIKDRNIRVNITEKHC